MAKGIETDPKKVEAVKNWTIPKTVTDVRSFLGFTNYYRRFIKDYAKVARPLNILISEIQKMETQPISGKGFSTSSAQNLSGLFGNLTTSFQVKADLDIGKFSGTEPVPDNE